MEIEISDASDASTQITTEDVAFEVVEKLPRTKVALYKLFSLFFTLL